MEVSNHHCWPPNINTSRVKHVAIAGHATQQRTFFGDTATDIPPGRRIRIHSLESRLPAAPSLSILQHLTGISHHLKLNVWNRKYNYSCNQASYNDDLRRVL